MLQLLDLPEKEKRAQPAANGLSAITRPGSEVYYAVHNRPMESMNMKASHHRFESSGSFSKHDQTSNEKVPLFSIGKVRSPKTAKSPSNANVASRSKVPPDRNIQITIPIDVKNESVAQERTQMTQEHARVLSDDGQALTDKLASESYFQKNQFPSMVSQNYS